MPGVSLTVNVVPYGPDAVAALRSVTATWQAEDPLAAVNVVVPRPQIGLATRRQLAAGQAGAAGHSRAGIVNVRFATLERLADQIAAPLLVAGGQKPESTTIVHAAVRAALAASDGPVVGPLRHHPAMVADLVAVYRQLRSVPDAALGRLASQSLRAADVVEVVRRARRSMAGWYGDHDRLQAAAAVLHGSTSRSVDPVVLYLPQHLDVDQLAFVRALASRVPVAAVVGATGDRSADDRARALVGCLSDDHALSDEDASAWPVQLPARPTSATSFPSPDAEVHAVTRRVFDRMAAGLPLEQMAILHPGDASYPPAIFDALRRSGMPFNGPTSRPLRATVTGRALLGLITVADGGWQRSAVAHWLASIPLVHDGQPAPAVEWDVLSCDAGVIGGAESWQSHLVSHAKALRRKAARCSAGMASQIEQQADQSMALASFMADVVARCEESPSTWSEWSAWSLRLVRRLLGSMARRAGWPAAEQHARDAVVRLLEQIGALDALGTHAGPGDFRAVVADALDAPAPQATRFGQGVFVGRVDEVVGMPLAAVFVLGMADGRFPPAPQDDTLLPLAERSAAGGGIPPGSDLPADARHDYLAVLASARERHLSFARGDQRRGGQQRPARWFLDAVQSLAGTLGPRGGEARLYSGDLEHLAPVPGYAAVPSLTAVVRAEGEAASSGDWDLRSLLRWHDRHGRLGGHPLLDADRVLAQGIRAHAERRSRRFTRFDGAIGRHDGHLVVGSPASGAVQSPTGLQTYAQCPRKYLFARLLRISARERPEEIWQISPLDRGSLVHEVLEAFVASQTVRSPQERIQPGQSWGEDGRRHLHDVAGRIFERYEQRGLTGRSTLWELDRRRIMRDLVRFLAEDDADRAELGSTPEAVELAFGPGEGAQVIVELDGGRRVEFRGRGDRVDRTRSGGVVVTDYKTGSPAAFRSLAEDPVSGGRLLQLPIYGLAARARFGDVPVRTRYWFVSSAGKFVRHGYDLDDACLDRFRSVVGVIADGIESGCFPANPGPPVNGTNANCATCDFTSVCPSDRWSAWERIREAGELSAYRALVERDPDGGGGGA